MSRLDDLHTLVRLLQEFELPVSPILEYSIKEKEEELMQTSTEEEHIPISFVQEKPIATSSAREEQKTKGKSEILRAEFPNGKVVQCNKATDTYVEVIEYAGPSAVSALGITHAGVNIVADTYDTQYASAQRKISGGWLVFTNTSTRQKQQDLLQICKMLNLDIAISLVSTSTGEIIEAEESNDLSTRQKIEVRFPDGKVIQPNRVYEAVVEVVKYAGAERVRDLNIITCGDNLVLKNPRPRYAKACKSVGNGWLVNTCSDTHRKYEQICHISETLHLGISAKIIGNTPELSSDGTCDELDNVPGELSVPQMPTYQAVNGSKLSTKEEYATINSESDEEENGLSRLLKNLSTMKVSQIKGSKSPHKAIYIMTIMEGVSEGILNPNKICIDTYLIQTYMKMWEKYVPKECPYTMDLCNPYMYLSSEPFYFLHFTVKPEPQIKGSWGVSSIKSICDYAYISDEFRSIIRSVANRIKIKTFLINQFNLIGSQAPSISADPMDEEKEERNDKTIIPALPKPQIRNQFGSAYFRISYPSGMVVESDSYNDVYVQFIKYANPQRVRCLNIRSLGANIIATKDEMNKKYEKMYKYVGDGYYFNTISTTQRKYEVMTYLSNALRLNVLVELLPK